MQPHKLWSPCADHRLPLLPNGHRYSNSIVSGDVDKALAEADHVVEGVYKVRNVTVCACV